MEFVLLGEVSVLAGGGALDLGPARQRCVLAALAVDAGRVVTVERLVERVWGDRPPLRSRATLLNYLSRLRLLLARAGPGAAAVVRRPGGYTLQADRFAVDLVRFHDLREQARAVDDRRAEVLLRQALELWRGEALTGVDGEWAEAERDRLGRHRLETECDLTDVLLRLGHGEDLVATLTARAARSPLDERVTGQLVLASHRAGRTADALAHYRKLRTRLVEHLGTEPGIALRNLHQRVLGADPTLTPASAVFSVSPSGRRKAAEAEDRTPRQLPAAPRWFTGRDTELSHLDQALNADLEAGTYPAGTDPGARAGSTVVISALGGAGGIGKTWLALAWAHRHIDRFPDGQLFTDLRGFAPTEQPVAPDGVLFGFLTALGVAPHRVPADLDAKAALYRSLVAGRRMLVVLDNAATSSQVEPLLPGSPSCAVLVTSRTRLASLIDRCGARHLQVDMLTRQEARHLLAGRLGTDRITVESDAVEQLIDLCGGYPLALAITARNATTRPGVPLAEIAAELREQGLDMLDHATEPAASLPAVLSWSLRRLTSRQRVVFGLLGSAPGTDTTVPALVALTGLSLTSARKALTALEEASLIERRSGGRYAMHDLIGDYAAATALDLTEDVRETALVRVMDFHLHTAHAADRVLEPDRPLVQPDPPAPGVHPHPLPDAAAALAWLQAEHATLLATQLAAAALGRHNVVWHLAWTLDTFHIRRGHRRDALAMWRVALDAAAHLPDAVTHIRTYRSLGHACARAGLYEEATDHLERSITLAVRHRDPAEEAQTHRALASAWGARGSDRRALEHAQRSLDINRALGQPALEAVALSQVGWYAARVGDFEAARAHCSAALSLCRRHHDPEVEAATLDSLGFIAGLTGDHRRAVDHYHQALIAFRTVGNTFEIANTLDHAGHAHVALGQLDQARDVWSEALGLYREQDRDDDASQVQRHLDTLPT